MKIAITGAGIAGLTAAIAFKQAGFETIIFEAAAEIKPLGAGLGLAPNAIKAFGRLGIVDNIIPFGKKLPFFRILDKNGKVITENDSWTIGDKFGLDNSTIHRHQLHKALLRELDINTIITGKRAVNLAPLNNYALRNVLIIGDAAHGATPNMGQGACQAIEDAAVLLAEISKNVSLEKAFEAFEKRRLEKTHYIINHSRKIG